jgi:hypothetical protein
MRVVNEEVHPLFGKLFEKESCLKVARLHGVVRYKVRFSFLATLFKIAHKALAALIVIPIFTGQSTIIICLPVMGFKGLCRVSAQWF